MSFYGYFHFGHPAFEFNEPSMTVAVNILHGDGWSLAGDSVGTTESAVCAFHGALSNRRNLCETFGLSPETTVSELILHIYNQQHEHANFEPLRGAFSFAILDKSRRKLLLVRDQLGREVLFHAALPNGTHLFSTSLNDLRRLPGFSPQISLKALFDYLSLGYVPSPHTIFRCVSKVSPGHCVTITESTCEDTAWWKPRFIPKLKINYHDAVAEAWRLLDIAVKRCLDNHPQANILLSGGIDSNLVMALASTSDGFGGHAFTVGFDDPKYDERSLAAISAKKFNVAHELMQVMPDAWNELSAAQRLNGEPFGDSSLIPTFCSMRLAKQHGTTAILTGSGGDEIFGGYRRYQAMAVRHAWRWLPNFIIRPATSLIIKILGEPEDARARFATLSRFAAFWRQAPLPGYAAFQEVFSEDLKQTICQDWTKNAATPYLNDWAEMITKMDVDDFIEQFNALDMVSYLPDDGCRKEALAAEMAGLTGDCPVMDMDLVEFGLALPRKLRVTSRQRKRVFHGIASYLLPPELLKQTKRGFGMPVSSWFRTECKDRLLDLASSVKSWDLYGWFKPEAIEQLCNDHLDGHRDNGARLWILLCLKTWLEQL